MIFVVAFKINIDHMLITKFGNGYLEKHAYVKIQQSPKNDSPTFWTYRWYLKIPNQCQILYR